MEETSQSEERADIKTRWKKGQSGNPSGRKLTGSGCTLTGLARTLLEQPVRSSASGEPITRLAEYMTDVVRQADAGHIGCRMFLLKLIDRGDRRKESAQRNARKAKTEDLRKFEEAMADEISTPMPPQTDEVIDQHAAPVNPTAPQRPTNSTAPKTAPPQRDPLPESAHAGVSADEPQNPETPSRSPAASAAMLRRDPRTGQLLSPDGRPLSREEEDRLLYPNWPHISPHLPKAPAGGNSAGNPAGRESPGSARQAVDSEGDSGSENILREFGARETDSETRH